MIRLNASDLKEGMILAQDVIAQNRVLLGAKTQLTTKHIHIFKTWGVQEACIEGDEDLLEQPESDLSEEEQEKIRLSVEERFSKTNSNPIVNELKRIVLKKELSTSP